MSTHRPVMLYEVLQGLSVEFNPDGIFIDCTFGRGGHAQAILDKLSDKGRLFAIDKDPEAVKYAKHQFGQDERLVIYQGSFGDLAKMARQQGIYGKVNGILFDLGVSSPQVDDSRRGFSFSREGPLDMRMNPEEGVDAATWLNKVSERDLARVLKEYGEERYSNRLARVIVNRRKLSPILTTRELADIIAEASPTRESHRHPATRSFQAIRIYINRELDELKKGLEQSLEVLTKNGRLVVISFHSLEDRMVKRFIKYSEHVSEGYDFPWIMPVTGPESSAKKPKLHSVGRLSRPSEVEIKNNPRARSAVLRIAEKMT